MGRLTASKSRLGSLKPRLGTASAKVAGRVAAPGNNWKKTARWQRLRRKILKRDGYKCQATGVLLVGSYPAPNSPVADHIIPHRGSESLFWDERNLQAVSKAYHDREKQKLERAGLV